MGRTKGAHNFPAEIVDLCLTTLAFTRQAKTAREQLMLSDVRPIPSEDTLRKWQHQYSGRIAELTERFKPDIEKHLLSSYLDVIAQARDITLLLLDKTKEQAEAGNLRDPAGSARNVATTLAIFTDKTLLIEGKPTSIVSHKSKDEALRSLASKFSIDGSVQKELPSGEDDG